MKRITDKAYRGLALLIAIAAFCATAPHLHAQTNAECYECHGEADLTTEDEQGNERSLFVDPAVFAASIHGEFECIDCHSDVTDAMHEDKLEKVDCSTCHDDAAEELASSVHGDALRERSPDAPSCASCHGTHNIRAASDPESMVSKHNQPQTCGTCHANPEVIARNNFALTNPVALYEKSIHGELTRELNGKVAACSNCHGAHDTRSSLDRKSRIHKLNIATTCSECHAESYDHYRISSHAAAVNRGATDAPSCIDCHGEHDILRPENPKSPTSGFNVAIEVCSVCHASERLTRKYGLATTQVQAFRNSFHGLALRGGKATVANCGSCHGVHDILPSSDPRSRIHPANLVETCGQCHPNAGENFTRGRIHLVGSDTREEQIVAWVRAFYITMIAVVIGFMILHNWIDLAAKVKRIRARKYAR